MQKKKCREPVAFETILAATEGDACAVYEVLLHFQPYINYLCRRKFIGETGSVQFVVDETMKRQLEAKLTAKILDFKIQR